jgi:acylphosphatase
MTGIVQGVFFRAHTRNTAQHLCITGWVRNRADGSVEITAEGSKDNLQQFIEWCHHGPASARVDAVNVQWSTTTGEFSDFTVCYR